MLQKAESTSTSRNKILICCSYYHTTTTCHATNLKIQACDWLRSVTRQRPRTALSMKKKHGGTRNERENTILFEKQLRNKTRTYCCSFQSSRPAGWRITRESNAKYRQWRTATLDLLSNRFDNDKLLKSISQLANFWQREAKKIQSEQRYRSWQHNATIFKVLTWRASVILNSNKGDILYHNPLSLCWYQHDCDKNINNIDWRWVSFLLFYDIN